MKSIFTIHIKNCAFYAYHGVLDFEKEKGQNFFVDAVLTIERPPEFGNDDLNDTVNYALVFELIEQITTKERYDLIETLAHEISRRICQKFSKVISASITVRKPDAPIDGEFDYVEVNVEARNDD
ncbi:dihydroneopterin aldolase [Lentilitoribacter sp. EG35]|uniref:dihydroneopterin aldolase n=1 Tax=Lentilitoribacter sp. EG35 TaxID=3234192 RepID=UPI003460E3C0